MVRVKYSLKIPMRVNQFINYRFSVRNLTYAFTTPAGGRDGFTGGCGGGCTLS